MADMVLSKNKIMEYITVDGLSKLTGISKDSFYIAIVKELTDNAMDACENQDNPQIKVLINFNYLDEATGEELTELLEKDYITLTVEDNGTGIGLDTLQKVFDFSRFSGTKYYYNNITRGAQGNALMAVLGMPYALNHDWEYPTVVCSGDKQYEIGLEIDTINQTVEPFINTKELETPLTGTRITVTLPKPEIQRRGNLLLDILHKIYEFSLLNPDIGISFKSTNPDLIMDCEPLPIKFKRYRGKEMVFWYSENQFIELVNATIRACNESGEDISILNFCKRFKGLSSTQLSDKIMDRVDFKMITQLHSQTEAIKRLYYNLIGIGKPMNPKLLGRLGKQTILDKIGQKHKIIEHSYSYIADEFTTAGLDRVPYSIECLTAEVAISEDRDKKDEDAEEEDEDEGNGREIIFGINYTPTLRTPELKNIYCTYYGSDFASLMSRYKINSDSPIIIFVHIICPNIQFEDYGKSDFDITPFGENLSIVFQKTFKFYKEKIEKAEKARWRKEKKNRQQDKERDVRPSMKSLILKNLKDVIIKVSNNYEFAPYLRQVYYQMRPILGEYGYDLEYGNYTRVIDEYERKVGKELLYREERGRLIEPFNFKEKTKSDRVMEVSTKVARAYQVPEYVYNRALYCEKRGFMDAILKRKLNKKYDFLLVGGQGYATDAIKTILTLCHKEGMEVMVLHDCDVEGLDIARTLEKKTRNKLGHRLKITDMGLNIREVMDLDLPVEKRELRKAIPKALERKLDGEEIEWLEDGNRTELNAFTTVEFLEWLEKKLIDMGLDKKVCPPDKVLDDVSKEIYEDKIGGYIEYWLNDKLDIDSIKDEIIEDFKYDQDHKDALKEELEENPPTSWRGILRSDITVDEKEIGKKLQKILKSIEF